MLPLFSWLMAAGYGSLKTGSSQPVALPACMHSGVTAVPVLEMHWDRITMLPIPHTFIWECAGADFAADLTEWLIFSAPERHNTQFSGKLF